MANYKRNQVEEAISGVLSPDTPAPSSELKTRIKRLLETDRGRDGSKYAFFSGKPPGSGTEIWFSDYEAFAVFIGLSLMQHGWTQGFAVNVMREVRSDLEKQYARTLAQDNGCSIKSKSEQTRDQATQPLTIRIQFCSRSFLRMTRCAANRTNRTHAR
jgi:hypothetical protein